MPILLFLFHGEQFIFLFLAALIVILAVLSAISFFSTRALRRRYGRRAYYAAPVPFLIAFIWLYIGYRSETPNTGGPEVISQSEAAALIAKLPDYASFGYSGVGFYGNKVYVTTNVGLFEIGHGTSRLFRFQKQDSVVSGPWSDVANNLLWVDDNNATEFVNYNGSEWKRVAYPTPAKGYYSRGDILEGARLISNPSGFWLASGGSAWRWEGSRSAWMALTTGTSPPNVSDSVVGLVPIRDKALIIIRHELLSFLVKADEEFQSDTIHDVSANMKEIPRKGPPFFAESVAATPEGAFICTRAGTLIKVTLESIIEVPAPGACESLSHNDQLGLIAGFRKEGIFKWDPVAGWKKLAAHPYPSGEGEYWSYLASAGDSIAYAVTAQPVVDKASSSGTDMKWKRNAPTALWIIKGGHTFEVDLKTASPALPPP